MQTTNWSFEEEQTGREKENRQLPALTSYIKLNNTLKHNKQ